MWPPSDMDPVAPAVGARQKFPPGRYLWPARAALSRLQFTLLKCHPQFEGETPSHGHVLPGQSSDTVEAVGECGVRTASFDNCVPHAGPPIFHFCKN
jgi:hypothetical protein